MAKALPDLALGDLLPPSIVTDDKVERAAKSIDPELRAVTSLSAKLPFYGRIGELDEDWVDHLAWQWHADAYDQARTLPERRYLAQNALILHRRKGTPWAVKTALKTLGFEYVDISEHWELNSPPYTFAVRAGPMTEGLVEDARRLIVEYKPARSQLLWIDFSFWLSDEEEPSESFYVGASPVLTDQESANEALCSVLGPDINEAVWPRARYSDPGLFYDGEARYDEQAENIEYVIIAPYATPEDQIQAMEVISPVIFLII